MKFLPTIESPKAPEPRFLTDSPYNLMRQGKIANKVPYLTGITENEGSLYVAQRMASISEPTLICPFAIICIQYIF